LAFIFFRLHFHVLPTSKTSFPYTRVLDFNKHAACKSYLTKMFPLDCCYRPFWQSCCLFTSNVMEQTPRRSFTEWDLMYHAQIFACSRRKSFFRTTARVACLVIKTSKWLQPI